MNRIICALLILACTLTGCEKYDDPNDHPTGKDQPVKFNISSKFDLTDCRVETELNLFSTLRESSKPFWMDVIVKKPGEPFVPFSYNYLIKNIDATVIRIQANVSMTLYKPDGTFIWAENQSKTVILSPQTFEFNFEY